MSGPRRLTPEKIARMLAAFEPAKILLYAKSGGNSGNSLDNKGKNPFPLENPAVGTVGTRPGPRPPVPTRLNREWEQPTTKKVEPFQGLDTPVPTVPTVPTEKQVSGESLPPGRWRDDYEERAAILEYEHGHPRARAERLAYECCVSQWLNDNPPPLDPDHCACCGDPLPPDGGAAVPVPRGEDASTHAWVRRTHYERWLHRRRAEAKAALAEAGLVEP